MGNIEDPKLLDRHGEMCRHPRTTGVHTPPPETVRVYACYECGGIWWDWTAKLRTPNPTNEPRT